MLLGLFVNSFAVLTQMEEPNFALPFPHLKNFKKNVHSNHTHSALYIMRSHECLRLPLLGAQGFKSEKKRVVWIFLKRLFKSPLLPHLPEHLHVYIVSRPLNYIV